MSTPGRPGVDSTLALLADGYEFISRRCERYGSDAFETRLLFEPTVCMRGAEAAEVFYDTTRFTRAEAAPARLVKTLFGRGGVQTLDGDAHHLRKAMFLSLMSADEIDRFVALTDAEWRRAAARWQTTDRVVLFDEMMDVLTRSVCAWAGVPLPGPHVATRTADLAAMIDAPGAVGYRYLRGRIGRARGNRWARGLIRDVRAGRLLVDERAALWRVATHTDADGTLLDRSAAAVELLNVLRPTVAIARYVVFVAMALHRDQQAGAHVRDHPGDDRFIEWFVQEVRRDYPFFPFVAARVRHDFDWHGHRFREGTRVLLDLYGTTHHERWWSQPGRFAPERFATWDHSAFDLIPQGGGDHRVNHRCAGEWMTIALMRHAVGFLTGTIDYEVPAQDLTLRLSRMPAIPRSRFVMTQVRLRG